MIFKEKQKIVNDFKKVVTDKELISLFETSIQMAYYFGIVADKTSELHALKRKLIELNKDLNRITQEKNRKARDLKKIINAITHE